MLAYHFGHGEKWSEARDYLVKAAAKATQSFANHEAIELLDQAIAAVKLENSEAQTQLLREIHQTKSGLYFLLGNMAEAENEAGQALRFARELNDERSQGEALLTMGSAAFYAHAIDRGLEHAQQAIEISERTNDDAIGGGGHFLTAVGPAVVGELDDIEFELDRSIEKSRAGSNQFYEAMATWTRGFHYNWRGEFEAAWRDAQQAVAVARESGLVFPQVTSLWAAGAILTGKGHYCEGSSYLEESITLSEKSGEEMFRTRSLNTIGWLLAETGDLEGAIEFNTRGAKASRERIGDAETLANANLNLADVFVLQRDFSPARELLEGTYRIVRNPATAEWMKWRYSIHLFASLAEYNIAKGKISKATEFTEQCLTLASDKRAKKYLGRGWRIRGQIAIARRQFEEAEDSLRSALTFARAIGNPTEIWKTQILTGELFNETGRPVQSLKAYQDARNVLGDIKNGLPDALQNGMDQFPPGRDLDERIASLR